MDQEINILYLEDNPGDATRVANMLHESGMAFNLQRVDTRDAFLSCLETPPDVILSDHGLLSFDGLAAFATARKKCPDVPFIFVTNALSREMEIEKLMGGVADYVRKSELEYLPVAMQHALREAKEWKLRKQRAQEFFVAPSQAETPLVPICSSCKKIRNKHNKWQTLEMYFLENLNIRFTHGVCPDCYPKFFSGKGPLQPGG